ncbi:MAG: methyltransferase domain-containing protein [Deltaproteobacteria bacterium]|nr:methyltransferase domain-containing protein [Deltaproteobacteria bacterium]
MDQEYSKRFYGHLAPAYDWVFGKAMEEGRREAARLVQKGQRVLEVGVGTGLGLKHYPSGCHVTGVDICTQMLRKARWRALIDGNGTRIDLRQMDATELGFSDECFDVVVAPYVVTTVGDPQRLCEEARRVCRRDGRIVVVSNTREQGLVGAIKTSLSPLMEKVGFSTDLDVEEVMRSAGLSIVHSRRVNPLRIHKLIIAERA